MKERIIVVLGEDTPEDVRREVMKFKDSAVLNFDWDNEDNECMPALANYLEERYKVFACGVI